MNEILIPVLVFAVLGTLMGVILAVASRLLAIKRDPRIDAVQECLPGANCGGCGYAGCASLAEAIAKGEAKVNACPANSFENVKKIAEIMGQSAEESTRMVAQVMCSGTHTVAKHRFEYKGITDCHSAEVLAAGDKVCAAGCIGLGSCVEKCAFDAIRIVDDVAVVDREKCRACGVCVAECPKRIIKLIPYDAKYFVKCASPEKGKVVRDACEAGCIGCRICEKNCPEKAIHMEGDMAVIDYAKCSGCGLCASKCPRKIIRTPEK